MTKIKTVLTYLATSDSPEGGYLSQREERDEQGNVCLLIQYNEGEGVELKNERGFDNDNRLLEFKQYTYSDQPDQHISYEYTAAGQLEKEIIRYLDGSLSTKTYVRNQADNSYEATTIDEDGDLEAKEYRRLDSDGRTLEERIYDEENELQQETSTSYDDYGRPIKMIHRNDEGLEMVYLYEYVLNDEGNLTEVAITNDSGKVLRKESVIYDDRGNRADVQIQDFEQGLALTEHREYDQNDKVVLHQRLSPDGSLLNEVKYTYREDGLLVEEENLSPRGASIRSYEYSLW